MKWINLHWKCTHVLKHHRRRDWNTHSTSGLEKSVASWRRHFVQLNKIYCFVAASFLVQDHPIVLYFSLEMWMKKKENVTLCVDENYCINEFAIAKKGKNDFVAFENGNAHGQNVWHMIFACATLLKIKLCYWITLDLSFTVDKNN